MFDPKVYKATKSAIAETLFHVDGKLISFTDYPFQRGIYDCSARSIIQKSARQLGKSTTASNFIIAECIAVPHFKTLYIAPSKEQTSKFSSTRLSKTIQYSPLVRSKFRGERDNVFLKLLTNGSEISLGYASDDPDRIRGITADRTFLDEIQDMDLGAIVPVVNETMGNSDYAYETFAGTPKSLENGIEWMWQNSSMAEWLMKCEGCNKYNFIDSDRSIGKKGPICVKCGHLLNPRSGFWYDFKPDAKLKGFHVSQPILPKNAEIPERWERILTKFETYPPAKFNNEVLGVSDAIGNRMISKEELESMCEEYSIVDRPDRKWLQQFRVIVGGVDWSGGGTQATSRTACWVWGLQADGKLKTLYFKIFPGRNQVEDVREVADIFGRYYCSLVCGDAGEGAVANAMLREYLGQHKVYPIQYGSIAKMIKWNGVDRWVIDKTGWIDSYMLLLKRKGVIFPNLQSMSEAIMDILAEYEEVTQNGLGKKVWRHSPNSPDDALQAQLLGWIALKIYTGEISMYEAKGESDG